MSDWEDSWGLPTPVIVEGPTVLVGTATGSYALMPETVDCDEECGALTDPETVEELRAALTHWGSHCWRGGCSHGI